MSYRSFWLSRNRLDGDLSSMVDIWLSKPERLRFADGDVQWVVLDAEVAMKAHYGRWTIEQAKHEVGNGAPDTDRELLYVERDLAPLEKEAA